MVVSSVLPESAALIDGLSIFTGVASSQNRQHRQSNEDSFTIVDHFGRYQCAGNMYFAVFDGHGTHKVADYCAAEMHKVLQCIIDDASTDNDLDCSREWAQEAFERVHDQLGPSIGSLGGACASVVWFESCSRWNRLHAANVGDCQTFLVRQNGEVIFLSQDHKPDDPSEKRRIEALGGAVIGQRVGGILNVSRSIGDYKGAKYLSRTPSYFTCDVEMEETVNTLVVCSDGLLDGTSFQSASRLAERVRELRQEEDDPGVVAEILVEEAIEGGSKDNCTAIVAFI